MQVFAIDFRALSAPVLPKVPRQTGLLRLSLRPCLLAFSSSAQLDIGSPLIHALLKSTGQADTLECLNQKMAFHQLHFSIGGIQAGDKGPFLRSSPVQASLKVKPHSAASWRTGHRAVNPTNCCALYLSNLRTTKPTATSAQEFSRRPEECVADSSQK